MELAGFRDAAKGDLGANMIVATAIKRADRNGVAAEPFVDLVHRTTERGAATFPRQWVIGIEMGEQAVLLGFTRLNFAQRDADHADLKPHRPFSPCLRQTGKERIERSQQLKTVFGRGQLDRFPPS